VAALTKVVQDQEQALEQVKAELALLRAQNRESRR
jgi:hypothetical protein